MKKNILVVENEVVIADDICLRLKKLDYQVLEPALTYRQALHSVNHELPDLVFIDLRLTGKKTGIDVARYILKHSNIPFVFITACGDSASMKEINQLKPLACLNKAFSTALLAKTMENAWI
jgi:CheY-like chemotaxis protein